jgi:replication factor C subunit 2/4
MTLTFVEKYGDPVPHKLWASDYQPNQLDDVTGNEQAVETLKSCLKNDRLPNLILCGPHGCGKSTIAKIVAEQYLGPYYKSCNMEVLGSIYRGKNVVTEKNDKKKTNDKSSDGPNIVNFIRKTTILTNNKCKIVTIFDFDCMTTEAQMALRRIIEIYSNKVRFIFICNDLNNVIEAIQSRALTLKFYPIGLDQIIDRLRAIAEINDIKLTDDIYDSIAIMSNGDLKQAINYLQFFSRCREKNITGFYRIFNIPSIKTVQDLINCCIKKNSPKAFDILNQLITNGYNVSDILDIIIKVISYSKDINDRQRVILIEETTKIICINEISPSTTHLYKLIVQFTNKN